MRIELESTEKIVELNGIPARIWEGKTLSGIDVHAYITRIAVAESELRTEEFERELIDCRKPSAAVAAIPARMIL